MSVKQKPVNWTGPMVYAVLETQRRIHPHMTRAIPAEPGQVDIPAEVMYGGFENAGYIGDSGRTEATDRLLAKALRALGWTPAELVLWANSSRGRHANCDEWEDVERVIEVLRSDRNVVREWLVDEQGPALGGAA